jgi:hypothetical protein
MANTIEVCEFVVKDMLRQTINNLQFVRNVSGEDMEDRFLNTPKKGESINVTKAARFVGVDGETFEEEAYEERTIPMVVQQTAGVHVALTNRELMFHFEPNKISERIVKPAAETLANKIDRSALQIATLATYNNVGTPASVPTALKTYNQARAKMSWFGTPPDSQHLLISPDMQVEAVDAGKAFFNPVAEISKQFRKGVVGTHAGALVHEVQNLHTNIVGNLGGTPLVNGASQTGASLITDGWSNSITQLLRKGNRFTIADVYAVKPWTRQSIGALQQFVVKADVDSDGSGNATISIDPPIRLDGAYQNVDALPANNAAITLIGAADAVTPQGLRFHPDAFLFTTFKQPEPGGVEFARFIKHPKLPIGMRYIRDWDTKANKQLSRIEVVWAFGVAFPEFACVVNS